jgi:hypothetical protein
MSRVPISLKQPELDIRHSWIVPIGYSISESTSIIICPSCSTVVYDHGCLLITSSYDSLHSPSLDKIDTQKTVAGHKMYGIGIENILEDHLTIATFSTSVVRWTLSSHS